MSTQITIAREKYYNEDGSQVVCDIHFSSLKAAYNFYNEDGFFVQPEFHGAKKTFPATDTILGGRCVVNFFEVPLS